MLDGIVGDIVAALAAAGISAAKSYDRGSLDSVSGPVVRVQIKSAEQQSAAFGKYIGTRKDPETGEETEVFSLRCGITLGLDIYAPISSAEAPKLCADTFDRAVDALSALSAGLKIGTLSCGETVPDPVTGLFRCRCEAGGTAYLTAESADGSARFGDFILKGVLRA